jgi:hypothetical protein
VPVLIGVIFATVMWVWKLGREAVEEANQSTALSYGSLKVCKEERKEEKKKEKKEETKRNICLKFVEGHLTTKGAHKRRRDGCI